MADLLAKEGIRKSRKSVLYSSPPPFVKAAMISDIGGVCHPLPSVPKAYSLLLQEEGQRSLHN